MVVMKMTHFEHIPDSCDDCIYYSCKPHPYKGWSEGCELCGNCMDDDQEDDWIYDGNSRPKKCPLMEIPTGSELQKSEKINCKATKCKNCTNHNYCDYEPQAESEVRNETIHT